MASLRSTGGRVAIGAALALASLAFSAPGFAESPRAAACVVDDRPFRALDAPLAVGTTVVLESVTAENIPPEEREGGGVLVPAATIQPSKAPASRSSDDRARLPLAGEPVNGFPNWQERVIHEWINRARVDPQADLAGCGTNCAENIGGYYTPQVPLIWDANAVANQFVVDVNGYFQ